MKRLQSHISCNKHPENDSYNRRKKTIDYLGEGRTQAVDVVVSVAVVAKHHLVIIA